MKNKILIKDASIVNRGKIFSGSVLIEGEKINKIFKHPETIPPIIEKECKVINAKGMYLIPGVIDDQVHFRDPGLTYKGDISSESKAAISGGVTSFMDMPNTQPQTTTLEALEAKWERAEADSYANYAFYLGATNDNINEIRKTDKTKICGVKVFLGSSTGNMLVNKEKALSRIFAESETLVAAHCEKEEIIKSNIEFYKNKLGDNIPIEYHPLIRSEEACYRSSSEAAELADKYGTQFHILHLSTAKELSLFDDKPLEDKKITGEVCVHHLWFNDEDYERLGSKIKWNPSIKTRNDMEGLLLGLKNGKVDIIATDHAPHLLSEKEGGCLQATSGGPLIQHSLQVMLQMFHEGKISLKDVVWKMCHNPAILFRVSGRGFIEEGFYADLVLIKQQDYVVKKQNLLYKCGWSPLEDEVFSFTIDKVFLNGKIAFENGQVTGQKGSMLLFDR